MNLLANNFFRNKSKSSRNQLHQRRLRIESLESRQLLSVATLTPVADNSLIAYKAATTPYSGGIDPSLYVGIEHQTGTAMRALIDFNLAAANIPAGATINSVTLSVYVNKNDLGGTASSQVQLHTVLANWGEGTSAGNPGGMPPFVRATPGDATWLNSVYNTTLWTTPGGDFSPTTSGTATLLSDGTTALFASTSQMVTDVRNWLNNPSTNFGWLLLGVETPGVLSGRMLDSREGANPPTLTIDYTLATPPPAPMLAIAATAASKLEGNSGANAFTFTVTRTGDTSGVSTVNYAVTGSGANAANAADFTGGVLPSGTVTFNAGVTSQVITVNVNGDTTVEPDEAFTVTLASPVGGMISTASVIGTILNDDTLPLPTLAIAATSASKLEGNSGANAFTFTVTRTGDTSGVSTVNYAITGSGANAANAADFTGGVLPGGTVTFNAGVTSQVISINVNGDTTVEPDETFTVTLASPVGATISTASAIGTILNDDTALPGAMLAIAATDANKLEGNAGSTALTFTVTRTGDTSGVTTVGYTVAGSGTNAANAADFTGGVLPSGTVTFNAGVTSQVITVNVNGDTTVEPDETFTVTLASPVGGTISTASATGTIFNDDTTLPLPTLAIAATDASKLEGNSGANAFTFTVTRTGDTSGVSTVNYAVAGSGTNAANAADFTGGVLPSGTVTFNAGVTSQVITVNVNGDTTVEPDETFTVTLAGPVGGTITTASAIGTILNDDTASSVPTLSINDVTRVEGNTGTTQFVFTVTLNAATNGPVSVHFATADGTATAATGTATAATNGDDHDGDDDDHGGGTTGDYAATSGTLDFAGNAGETQTITISVYGDTTVEPDETFYVNLSSPTNATLSKSQGVGTIQNDDTAQSAGPTISGVMVAEASEHRDGVLATGERLVMTFNAVDPDGVVSATLQVDGKDVTSVYGPYRAASGVNFAALLGTLSAGSHTYSIVATDRLGNSTSPAYTGTFNVVASTNAGPTISGAMVVEATEHRDGVLATGERLVMTFNAVDPDGVASATLQVDGKDVTSVYGPYRAASGVNFAALLGTLSAGSHTYSIVATDRLGNSTSPAYAGTFDVVAAPANAGPTISGAMVVEATAPRDGVLTTGERLVMTFNAVDPDGVAGATLQVDGKNVTSVYGPYRAASGVNFAVLLGTRSAGSHTYSIVATDKAGNPTSSAYTGTFNVAAALVADAAAAPQGSVALLTDQELAPIVLEAERRLAMAGNTQVLAAMANVKIQLADLPGGLLGEAVDKTILIDRDAAGYGWFIDSTPADDLEFGGASGPHSLAAGNDSPAAQRVDLLTTVMHEMGHVLGYEHSNSVDLMSPTLSLGTRRSLGGQPALSMETWDSDGAVGSQLVNAGALDQVFASF